MGVPEQQVLLVLCKVCSSGMHKKKKQNENKSQEQFSQQCLLHIKLHIISEKQVILHNRIQQLKVLQ